jgi:DNA polymerase-3 subunit alpha
MKNYCVYHLHSDLSLLDSTTNFKDYVNKAVESGMTAIASTEHGLPRSWVEKKLYCDEKGIKFIHGVEIYLTEALEPKVRDNYHTILLAKNIEGVHELNRLIELSSRPDHMYYSNRLSFDEFLAISSNIIKISACLASPLRRLPPYHERFRELLKHYDYLEVQPHSNEEQADYNRKLMHYSDTFGIPLIAGTDTHSLNQYKAECRDILMWRKEQFYPGEEGFDLTWHSCDELLHAFQVQNALPPAVYLEAIENTNVMADSVDNFELNKSIKYPILYGSPENDTKKLHEVVWRKLDEKLETGIIPREQEQGFRDAISEEFRVFEKIGMSGFILCMHELLSWCRDSGMYIGPGRGSVGGSRVAYVADIIDINPEQWNTNFARFANEDRKEIGRTMAYVG